MKAIIDVSDLNLDKNVLFRLLEPYLMDCALNYCASYKHMDYDRFYTEMIEYLFSGDYFDEDDRTTEQPIMDRINDLEEHEFNFLVMISYTIYQRVTTLYKHIWDIDPLKEAVLVMYIGTHRYLTIEVDIELVAPDHLFALVHNRRFTKKRSPALPLTYIPQGI